MVSYKSFFKNKKITLMGLGLLGRGVGDAAFLASLGVNLIVTDLKNSKQLSSSLKKLSKYKNIKFVLGKHRLEDFRNRDMILKAAGVPLNSPFVQEARKHRVPVEMSSALFARLSGLPIIGITGTRGKSTVTHLIAHILKTAGKKVITGGNVKGVSTLSFLPRANKYDFAVLELDSWQLQGFGEDKISPGLSIFTTFLPDHMNYYGNSMKKYFLDKANIFKYQNGGDVLITGRQAYPYIKKWGGKIDSRMIVADGNILKKWKFNLEGKHNAYNAAIAIKAAGTLGISDNVIKRALSTFKPVEGHLELIKNIKGIKIYNDTNSTTPDATVAALKAVGSGKNIILIAGGADKNLSTKELTRVIKKYAKEVILLSGTGTNKLISENPPLKKISRDFGNIEDAVNYAYKTAERGDVILFSPGFASFGMFKNEYHRGAMLNKIVSKLK
jgi:UDP-N-acetylmuramoylalanine--D-glutamate ligase